MTTLEQRHFVATDADIIEMADTFFDGVQAVNSMPGKYMNAVIGTAQHELDIKPRAAKGKPSKLEEQEIQRQLNGVNTVHDRLYEVFVKRIDSKLPKGGKDRAKELNRLTNRFRTAVYAIRQWVKAGRDLGRIIPGRATKASLHVGGPKRARRVSAAVLRKRVEKRNTELVAAVLALAEADKAAAIGELELLVGQLAQQLNELNQTRATTDPKVAHDEHRPLRVGKSIFVPVTETQVLRHTANPS